MPLEPGDRLATVIDRPRASEQDHTDAYACLQRRHAEGTLPPIIDDERDSVTVYAEILGIKQ